MSQYVPGAIDYIPVIQPYKPNLNFFQQVLQTKQSQYNAGYDKISGLYGTMLESPMLKTENLEARNKFFNDIAGQIQKISSLDLSRRENIDAASMVFQPLIDNDFIMKDMAFTKKYQQALDRHEYFKNCTDEKKCGGRFWEEGLAYVQYKAEDFVNASLEDSLKMANPEYVPYTNAVEKAMQFAKEMNFKKQDLVQNGKYNIITENGAQAVAPLSDIFIANFSKDGNIRRTYDVLSYLKRKDYAKSNADKFNGSEEEAEMHYLNSIGDYIEAESVEAQEAALNRLDLAKTKQTAIEDLAKSRGLDPNDPDDKALMQEHEQSITDQLILQGSADINNETAELVNKGAISSSDINTKRARIDAAMANNLFTTDMYQAAESYAELTQKIVKFEADPYALASHSASLSLRNSLALEKARFDNEVQLGILKGDIVLHPEAGNETLRDDNVSPGGTAKVDDLAEQEKKSEVDLGLSVGGALDGVSKDIMGYANMVLDPQAIGKKLSDGTVVTKAIQDQVRAELEYVYGANKPADNGKVNILGIATQIGDDGKVAIQPPGFVKEDQGFFSKLFTGWSTPNVSKEDYEKRWISDQEPQAPKEKQLDRSVSGFLNPDGSLVTMSSNSSLYDPNSNLHYDKVIDRLAETMGREGSFLKRFVTVDKEIQNGFKNLNDAKYNLQIESDRIGKNTALILNSNPKNMNVDLSGATNANAQAMVNRIAVGTEQNKHFVPREQWINDYVKSYTQSPGAQARATRIPGFGSADPAANQSLNEAIARDEAGDLYDAYIENFNKEYNRASDATQPYKGFKPPSAFKVGDGGAFLQANTYTIEGVSTQFPGATGAQGTKYTWNDLSKALADPMYNDKIAVLINQDPGQFTNKSGDFNIDDLLEKDMNERVSSKGVDVIGMLYGRLASGADTRKEAIKFSTSVYPIAGNNQDLVAVKFTLNPETSYDQMGSSATLGLTGISVDGDKAGPVRTVSIIMPKAAVSDENPFFSGLNQTIDDRYVNTYGSMSVTGYDAGRAYLKAAGDHGFDYQIFTTDETGQEVATGGYIPREQMTAGQWGELVRGNFAQEEQRINLARTVARNTNPNRVFDLSLKNMTP